MAKIQARVGVSLAIVVIAACSSNSKQTGPTSTAPRPTTTIDLTTADPDAVAQAFVVAISSSDTKALTNIVAAGTEPPLPWYTKMRSQLGVTKMTFKTSKAVIDPSGVDAQVPLESTISVATVPTITLQGSLHLSKTADTWLIDWSPSAADAVFTTSTRFTRTTTWPTRAPIVGANNAPLTTNATIITVGVTGARIKDAAALKAALATTGASRSEINAAITKATSRPSEFVSIIDMPESEYLKIKPTIYPIGGTVFRTRHDRAAISADIGAHLVGSTGIITKEQLAKLGAPYNGQSVVGRSGLEAAFERQLAGSPGGTLAAVDAHGKVQKTLATTEPTAGTPVVTTIDSGTQHAAETALDGVPGASAIVAIRVSTGGVIASVSRPTATGFDIALTGHYPPGSTFKIISTANLIEHGSSPTSMLTCPKMLQVGSQTFQNFEGESFGALTLNDAFAKSCNTAFIGATSKLPNATFPSVAAQFGIGVPYALGMSSYSGNVPQPTSDVERGATTIGQARVTVSPLTMASVAACVARGSWISPQLTTSNSGAPASHALDANVVNGLRTMMHSVVANGTATGRGLPTDTFGKTGTAEFGTVKPFRTHAWFVGYRGDVAFAVLVDGGGVGGRVAAPIAAKFLNQLG